MPRRNEETKGLRKRREKKERKKPITGRKEHEKESERQGVRRGESAKMKIL
jgi:hypothetical protein